MYIVLLDPLFSPVQLQQVIDNSKSDKLVGLREITFTAGWHNISKALGNNTYVLRTTEGDERVKLSDGYYNVELLEKQINTKIEGFKLDYNVATGYITVVIPTYKGTMNFLKLSEIFGGSSGWFGSGSHVCKNVPQFYSQKAILVHLDQINTSENILARDTTGSPSTLLRIVPTNDEEMGQITTATFIKPQFCKLCEGYINELTISILDIFGNKININNNYICITLEIKCASV